MHNISVRLATIDDAGRIADIHVRAWQSAYRDILPHKALAELSVDDRTSSWQEQISDGAVKVLIAEDEARPCGWIAFGPSRDVDIPSATEVYAVYLDPDLTRRGMGRMLWSEVLRRLPIDHHEPLSVWVLKENTSAQRFYEAMGGQIDAQKPINLCGVKLEEVRYRCPVSTAGA